MLLGKYKKKIVITAASALIFFAVTMPFRKLFQVVTVTEVRPAAAFNPLFGLLFGIPGAIGCALGNFAADILTGYSPLTCLLGFPIQALFGLFPHFVWKKLGGEVRLNTSKNVFRYFMIILVTAVLIALLLGAMLYALGNGSILSTTRMFFHNNFVFGMVLGIPMLLTYTSFQIKKSGGRLSLSERFILLFLFLAILSAAMIGVISYIESYRYIQNPLDLWNRVYDYISADLFIFFAVIILFLRYGEKNITVPMENLADVAREYIQTEDSVMLDAKTAASRCGNFSDVQGEAGELAEAFKEMFLNIEKYIANLTKVTAENERISTELNLAKQIQADMLPRIFPAFPARKDFDVFASMNPAKEVGGDFYDFFLIDSDHLALVIADVSGKGVPAALFMVVSKTLLKNQIMTGQSPKDILTAVNKQLCENNESQMFVTVWLGILEISTGKLTASNAGHEYPAVRRANGKFELFKDKRGFVLAGMENSKYTEYELYLGVGDVLLVYTDGAAEATDSENRLYGTERMINALNDCTDVRPEAVISYLRKDIDSFVGTAVQFDDITMLAVTLKERPACEKTLTLSAAVENWSKLLDFLEENLANISLKERIAIETAAEEIYVNIARYAYPNGSGSAEITLRTASSRAELVFKDRGIPYNPLKKSDPDITLSADKRQIGGLGIYMVKQSMDEVSYEYVGEQNVFTIAKNIGGSKATACT